MKNYLPQNNEIWLNNISKECILITDVRTEDQKLVIKRTEIKANTYLNKDSFSSQTNQLVESSVINYYTLIKPSEPRVMQMWKMFYYGSTLQDKKFVIVRITSIGEKNFSGVVYSDTFNPRYHKYGERYDGPNSLLEFCSSRLLSKNMECYFCLCLMSSDYLILEDKDYVCCACRSNY